MYIRVGYFVIPAELLQDESDQGESGLVTRAQRTGFFTMRCDGSYSRSQSALGALQSGGSRDASRGTCQEASVDVTEEQERAEDTVRWHHKAHGAAG